MKKLRMTHLLVHCCYNPILWLQGRIYLMRMMKKPITILSLKRLSTSSEKFESSSCAKPSLPWSHLWDHKALEPKSFKQAIASTELDKWLEAIKKERWDALIEKETWEEINKKKVPNHHCILHHPIWRFKKKLYGHYKATRLCFDGRFQKEGVGGFDETFSHHSHTSWSYSHHSVYCCTCSWLLHWVGRCFKRFPECQSRQRWLPNTLTPTSAAKAEFIAASEAVKGCGWSLLWLRTVQQTLGEDSIPKFTLGLDSRTVVELIKQHDVPFHGKTKHIFTYSSVICCCISWVSLMCEVDSFKWNQANLFNKWIGSGKLFCSFSAQSFSRCGGVLEPNRTTSSLFLLQPLILHHSVRKRKWAKLARKERLGNRNLQQK